MFLIIAYFICFCCCNDFKFDFNDINKNRPFSETINEKSKAVILLYSGIASNFHIYFSIFQKLYNNESISNKVTIACYDYDKINEKVDFPISQDPEILIFNDGAWPEKYYGEWTEEKLSQFCYNFAESDNQLITYMNDVHEAQDFIAKLPVNVIYYGESTSNLFNDMKLFFNKVYNIPFGIINNEQLLKESGISNLPIAQLNIPLEETSLKFQKFDFERLKQKIVPKINPLYKNQIIGNAMTNQWTLISIIDRSNSYHVHIVAEVIRQFNKIFGSIINYELCDFFDYPSLVRLSGVTNNSNPLFCAMRKYTTGIFKDFGDPIFYEGRISPVEIRKWFRRNINKYKQVDKLAARHNIEPIPILNQESLDYIKQDKSFISIVMVGDPQNDPEFTKMLLLQYKAKVSFHESKFVKFYLYDSSQHDLTVMEMAKIPSKAFMVIFQPKSSTKIILPSSITIDEMISQIENLIESMNH